MPAPAPAIPFFGQKGPKLPPNVVRDETLAYTFTYPLKTADGVDIPITTSRKPEKYSSAAPLTADARQRIVSQFVSLSDGITMTMFVGPASGALAATDPAKWRPKDVATAVLTDRSAVPPPPPPRSAHPPRHEYSISSQTVPSHCMLSSLRTPAAGVAFSRQMTRPALTAGHKTVPAFACDDGRGGVSDCGGR